LPQLTGRTATQLTELLTTFAELENTELAKYPIESPAGRDLILPTQRLGAIIIDYLDTAVDSEGTGLSLLEAASWRELRATPADARPGNLITWIQTMND
jgi:hypothetical protein